MPEYIALIRKSPDSDYSVEFPDLPGCFTAGPTVEAARASAIEALALHIEGMTAEGIAPPKPSSPERILDLLAEDRDALAMTIPAPVARVPHKRINVTLPEDVIKAIDAYTDNRSAFLTDAARDLLAIRRGVQPRTEATTWQDVALALSEVQQAFVKLTNLYRRDESRGRRRNTLDQPHRRRGAG